MLEKTRKQNSMRMFLISLGIAALLCVPEMAGRMAPGTLVPLWLDIPASGMRYMMLLFHEIGHTLGWWIFGFPAIPTFNVEYGGGTTYYYDQSWIVICFIWLGAGALAAQLWQAGAFTAFRILGAGLLLHGLLLLCGGDELLPLACGHLAEISVGSFCLLRAFLGTTDSSRGATERWLNMIFGCFTLVHTVGLTAILMFHEVGRIVYASQKGKHLQGDLDRLALGMNIPMPAVAATLMLLTIGLFAVAIYQGYTNAPRGPLPEKKAARRI